MIVVLRLLDSIPWEPISVEKVVSIGSNIRHRPKASISSVKHSFSRREADVPPSFHVARTSSGRLEMNLVKHAPFEVSKLNVKNNRANAACDVQGTKCPTSQFRWPASVMPEPQGARTPGNERTSPPLPRVANVEARAPTFTRIQSHSPIT
jgi:hypothetical protein